MFKMKKPPNGWQLGASELPFGKQSTPPIINVKVFFFFLLAASCYLISLVTGTVFVLIIIPLQ